MLSQVFYHCFFHCLCIDSIFLMSYFSKLLKRLPSLSMGSFNSTFSGTRAQCGSTKAVADCWGPALLCCHSSLRAGSQERVSQGTWSWLHKAVTIQRLAHCHRDRNSARNQQIKKILSLLLAKQIKKCSTHRINSTFSQKKTILKSIIDHCRHFFSFQKKLCKRSMSYLAWLKNPSTALLSQ